MNRKLLISILIFIGATLLLLPNFYRNRWSAVDPEYYAEWQTRYDRLIVARLVETRQHGFFSAGGLLGLGDAHEIAYDTRTHRHQFNTYFNNEIFRSYFIYKSNPGFQGFMYGLADQALSIPGEQKLKLFRGFTAFLSAITFAGMITIFATEFGPLAGVLVLAFAVFSMWIVLPAGSIFWDYWAFYLPFLASIYVLADASRKNAYDGTKVHAILFAAVLMRLLLSGFDMTTTVLVMSTVPFVFYAIHDHWDLSTFFSRMIKAGVVMLAATITALIILAVQILASEKSFSSAYTYLLNRFTSHTGGDYEYFNDAVPRKIHVMEVIPKYLVMPAIDVHVYGFQIQVLYWHLILLFGFFTFVFFLNYRIHSNHVPPSRKALALVISTWYSILAPISWYVTFKPHSFIHTHVNTMGWQMPFTLLGFALCGFVITDLFTSRQIVSEQPSPASQTDSPLQNDTYTPRPRA
jgi:hypothetical protein